MITGAHAIASWGDRLWVAKQDKVEGYHLDGLEPFLVESYECSEPEGLAASESGIFGQWAVAADHHELRSIRENVSVDSVADRTMPFAAIGTRFRHSEHAICAALVKKKWVFLETNRRDEVCIDGKPILDTVRVHATGMSQDFLTRRLYISDASTRCIFVYEEDDGFFYSFVMGLDTRVDWIDDVAVYQKNGALAVLADGDVHMIQPDGVVFDGVPSHIHAPDPPSQLEDKA